MSVQRSTRTLNIEARIRAGHPLSTIANDCGVTRQRVHSIKVRLCQHVGFPTFGGIPSRLRETTMISLKHKPVDNRNTRPQWVMNDKQMMEKCVGKAALRRFKVAQMFWRQNMSAQDIAVTLDTTLKAVEHILDRLRKGW